MRHVLIGEHQSSDSGCSSRASLEELVEQSSHHETLFASDLVGSKEDCQREYQPYAM